MADTALRTRDQPDIRARISINDESPTDLKHQLEIADQTQRALRSQQSWHPPADISSSPYRSILRKTKTLPYRPGQCTEPPASDALPYPLPHQSIRSNSLTSLSTLHREAEAASLSLYRGSPISAISPPCVAPTWAPSVVEYEPQDPCPPRPPYKVETLSQQRSYQKLLAKSMKKKKKEDEQLRREALAADVAASRQRDADAKGEAFPLRTKSTKSLASHVVKHLSFKRPLSRLSRQVKKEKSDPPTLDDFDSKEQIREYLNPSPPPPSSGIAELPAELPEYTPFEDSTRTQDNEPVTLLEGVPPSNGKEMSPTTNDNGAAFHHTRQSTRSMRCDSCQSPIRLHQVYYHCSICEDGDRILCSSCDQAGWSCRHDITEKVRNVSRSDASGALDPVSASRERSRSEAQQYAAAMWGLSLPDFSTDTIRWSESPVRATMSAVSPWAYNDIVEREKPTRDVQSMSKALSQTADEARDLELRRREQEISWREKEIVLREREATLREHQAAVREQEAALSVKQQMFTLQLQSALTKQMNQLSLGVGAQFQDLSQNDNIRRHATKRKAGSGQSDVSPSQSTKSNQRISPKRTPSNGQDPDDEDQETGEGSPKKVKQDPDVVKPQTKLFACPYSKYDKSRYSEQNVHEKHYRGCTSGFWTDISRLKQHLYRVHWRRIHCGRCYLTFENQESLDEHLQLVEPCPEESCPFSERFDGAQCDDIRRKRPSSSHEQVWYTIYAILFPGAPLPSSPYADRAEVQSAASPSVPETQDTMDVLGELFESRLDQHSTVPGQDWLRSSEAREFIRQQLRASMTDVLQRLRPTNSPSIGNPSADVSPSSALLSESARPSSSSWTPASSIPPSPVRGPGSATRSASEAQFLLPGHRKSFSRPLPARSVPNLTIPQPTQSVEDTNDALAGVTFPATRMVDPENDVYDDQSNSWKPGDEMGLAISTDFNFGFASTLNNPTQMESMSAQPSAFASNPVQQAGEESFPQVPPSDLKPKHSTTSSVDSGYGSLGHASSSASSGPTPICRQPGRDMRKGRVKRRQNAKESSPVPESDINFDAFDVSFQDFMDGNFELDMDWCEDLNSASLDHSHHSPPFGRIA